VRTVVPEEWPVTYRLRKQAMPYKPGYGWLISKNEGFGATRPDPSPFCGRSATILFSYAF